MLFNRGNLVKEKEWFRFIDSIKTNYNKLEKDKKSIKKKLKNLITKAIEERSSKKFGILFSGGIDSSLIAIISKKLKSNFICYSVGLEGSSDLVQAKEVAKRFRFKLKLRVVTLDELEKILKKVVRILKEPDAVKAGVGCVFYKAFQLAKEDKIKEVFTGLGSEELFAGYQRHRDMFESKGLEAVHKECFKGLKSMYKRDLIRDSLIAKDRKMILKLPLLDDNVIEYAMKIHPKHKITKNKSKIIIRDIAEEIGLKEFALRKKKAAQYGSGFHRGLKRLAKRNGYKYIKDYLENLIKKN